MERNYKKVFRAFFAWNYLSEIESLNKASEEGWQLIKGGCYHSKFVEDHNVRFRYQLDYQRNIPEMGRYIEMFREQGWEYINSTFNGWHYFRKLYDPSLPEEAYEIFTDRESINEMTGRFSRIATTISIILGLGAIVYAVDMFRKPKLPTLLMLLVLLIECGVLLRGALVIKKSDRKRSAKDDTCLVTLFLAVILIGAFGSIALKTTRPYFTTEMSAGDISQPVKDQVSNSFDIKYTDNYFIDLDLESTEAMNFKILDEEGNAVFNANTFSDLHLDDYKLKLIPGTYSIAFSANTGYYIKMTIE